MNAKKWLEAWVVDLSHSGGSHPPWCTTHGSSVHLIWSCKRGIGPNDPSPQSGLFHLEWSPGGFQRKIKVATVEVSEWDAAIEPKSGRLLAVFSTKEGIQAASRSPRGDWSRVTKLPIELPKEASLWYVPVSVEAAGNDRFLVRTGYDHPRAWELVIK
jgi:hypothetical protein